MRRASFEESRADQSVTHQSSCQAGKWAKWAAATRHTRHSRSFDGSAGWFVTQAELPPGHGIQPLVLPSASQAEITEMTAISPGLIVGLSHLSGTRSYQNSEGAAWSISVEEWQVTVGLSGASQFYQAPARDAATLVPLVRHLGARALRASPARTARCRPASKIQPTVLDPLVARILIHELIGHALEENDSQPGDQVLPVGFVVTAHPAAGRTVDDEGVPTRPETIVADGCVVAVPHGRPGCSGSGHSWVGLHQIQPQVRLINLSTMVNPGITAGGTALPDQPAAVEYLHCHAVRGARYYRNCAVLDVVDAHQVCGSGSRVTCPFRLLVWPDHLRRARSCREPAADYVPLGQCVKNGDPLISDDRCPALIVDAVASPGEP
jgi:hypothetical protein